LAGFDSVRTETSREVFVREPCGNFENSTRHASYRRFRRRRRAWPLLSALALATFLVGAGVLLSPDRINPVEIASVEKTESEDAAGDPESGGTSGKQPEDAVPESEEGSSEASEPDASSDSAESAPEPRDASQQEAPEEGPRQAASGDDENSDERAGGSQEEDRATAPPPPANKDMSLTVPRLGVSGDSVTNSADPQVLHEGAQKLPSTGFPWQDGANTYIAGHRLGFPGTESHNQFYNLPAMQEEDPVYLTDANGETYEYRVTEIFAVSPSESWVTEPVAGRDMVTLQTCTHSPDDWWSITPQLFGAGPESGRLVVRADRV
jgi:sortase A